MSIILATTALYFLSLIVGLLVSLLIGQAVMTRLVKKIDANLPPIEEGERGKGVPPKLTGCIERFVFTTAWTLADASSVGAGMFAWLGLKMAANWNRDIPGIKGHEADFRNRWAFAGLLKGFVSMALAALGGIVANKSYVLFNFICSTFFTAAP